jgi:hypothetical protein
MSDIPIIGEDDNSPVPTVIAQAIKVIHPLFQDSQTGNMIPPPPDHEFRVGFQVAITTKGRVVQETPGIFFISGDDKEDIAEKIKDLVLQGLEEVESANRTIQKVGPEHLHLLKKFETEGQ